ncbi:hypothetical protein [Streptomyces sp. NPDC001070]
MNTEPEPEEEWELGVLLERVVPQPSAPADRMAQIRRRVRRRRRRRLAATTTAAVGGVTAMVVAAAMLQPAHPLTPRGQRIAPAASPARPVPVPGSPLPAPTRSADPGFATVRLDDLSGLTLPAPRGWSSLLVADPQAVVVGFVGSGPLHERGECSKQERITYSACPPVDRLTEGGVLLSFHWMKAPDPKDAGDGRFLLKGGVAPASTGCRTLGGDRELTAWGTGLDGRAAVGITATACLHRPTKALVDTVVTSLRAASFGRPDRGTADASGTPG